MRVTILGLGEAGHDLHIPALRGLAGVEIVGACDRSGQLRERAHETWGIPVFEDSREMQGRLSPDVVVVATPPHLHAQHCIDHLEAGSDVICEKPFASSLGEADRVLAVAKKQGKRIAVNHEFREMPIFKALLEEIKKGDVGALQLVQAWQLIDMAPWNESGWRSKIGHRTLFEAGIHLIDLIVALFGERPHSVSAAMSNCGAQEGEGDAVSFVTLWFSGNRMAQITQNRLCKGERQYFEVRADCTAASLRASFGGRARLTTGLFRSTRPHLRFERGISGIAWSEAGSRRRRLCSNPKDPTMVATRDVFKDSLASFLDGSEPPTSGAKARDIIAVIAAAYRSAETGRRVTIDAELERELADARMGIPKV